VKAPILSLSDFTNPLAIETDASEGGVRAVHAESSSITFINKSFGPKLKGLSTYEKEYVAILLAVQHWRPYLYVGRVYLFSEGPEKTIIGE
jgi:hypothetical protein